MQPKFTPGPWTKITEREERYSSATGQRESDWIWHKVSTDNCSIAAFLDTGGPTSSEVIEANAFLVAAGPKLYDMLVKVQKRCDLGSALYCEILDVLAEARGELSKDKGEG